MQKENLQIIGMSCAVCAKTIERVTMKLDGVSSSSVNFSTEKLAIEFDEQKVSIPIIKEAVTKAGYEVLEKVKEKEITIPIQGM